MTATICGTGSYIPSYTMDNHDIAKLVDTSDEWIRERTGIAGGISYRMRLPFPWRQRQDEEPLRTQDCRRKRLT